MPKHLGAEHGLFRPKWPRDPLTLLMTGALLLAIGAAIGYSLLKGAVYDDVREHGATTTGEFKYVSTVTLRGRTSVTKDFAWYSYEVDGKQYSVRDSEEVREADIVRGFPDRVVHYRPNDPRTAVVGEWTTTEP